MSREGYMRSVNVPSEGYEVFHDEKPGMVHIRIYEVLGPAPPREEPHDDVIFTSWDVWEFEQEGIEQYVASNLDWLKQKAKAEEEAALAAEVRAERNRLLAKADIAVNLAVDNGDSEAESRARTWRQALRDIPEQSGFPYDVVWPKL
ncbi:hypothetical protein SDC9_65754 [bioreactor metagenome]|uniref:Phage tail assembly chaperone-like domain-containing protein n=1 Tax=bioreactor metagenome TaxID=1076179 RepID=A0A644XU94_9ZZZZ